MSIGDELIERARGLAPIFAERAQRTEEKRSLPDESVQELIDSGMLATLTPRIYGGHVPSSPSGRNAKFSLTSLICSTRDKRRRWVKRGRYPEAIASLAKRLGVRALYMPNGSFLRELFVKRGSRQYR